MIGKRFFDVMDALEKNTNSDPKAIVRDPELNRRIDLPIVGKENFIKGFTEKELAEADPSGAARRVAALVLQLPRRQRRRLRHPALREQERGQGARTAGEARETPRGRPGDALERGPAGRAGTRSRRRAGDRRHEPRS